MKPHWPGILLISLLFLSLPVFLPERVAGQGTALAGALSPTSGEVSTVVVTITPPMVGRSSTGPELGRLFQDILTASPSPTLADVISGQGGDWRIIESVPTVQMAIFLPLPLQNAEELTAIFLKHLVIRMADWQPGPRPPCLADELRLMVPPTEPGKSGPVPGPAISLQVNGPLKSGEKRLLEILKGIRLPGDPAGVLSSATPSGEITLPGQPPTLIRLGIWPDHSFESQVSARFLGERFVRVPTLQGATYDVWTVNHRTVGVYLATATLEQMGQRSLAVEGFLPDQGDIATSTDWDSFSTQCHQLLLAELRDLEKGAFLSAWSNHWDAPLPTSRPATGFPFLPPQRWVGAISFPEADWHRFLLQTSRTPPLAAARFAGSGDLLDLTVVVRGAASTILEMKNQLPPLLEMEVPGVSLDLPTAGELEIHFSAPPPLVTPRLAHIKRGLQHIHLPPTPEDKPLPNGHSWSSALAGAGDILPFDLLGRMAHGWPAREMGPPSTGGTRLNKEILATILGLPPESSPTLLKGRWTLKTSTPQGWATILARLLVRGIDLAGLRSLPGFF